MRKHPRIFTGVLAAVLVLVMAFPAGASLVEKTIEVKSGIGIVLDDSKLQPKDVTGKTVDVFSTEGTTYVPARALSEALGKSVVWDSAAQAVRIGGYEADEKNEQYLETYFDIAPFSAQVTRAEFDAALKKIGGSATGGSGTLTVAEAAKAAVADWDTDGILAALADSLAERNK